MRAALCAAFAVVEALWKQQERSQGCGELAASENLQYRKIAVNGLEQTLAMIEDVVKQFPKADI